MSLLYESIEYSTNKISKILDGASYPNPFKYLDYLNTSYIP
jgi:hypothetical protein